MKIKKNYLTGFLATFLFGSASVLLITQFRAFKYDSLENPKELATNAVQVQPSVGIWSLETVQEIDNYTIDEKHPFKIDLLETGSLEGDILDVKSGEIWLGLFKENDEYFLRPAKLKTRTLYDDINDKKVKIGKIISLANNKEPIFLVKNANILKKGKINTLFKGMNWKEAYLPDESELSPIEKVTKLTVGFFQTYKIGGKHYELKVINVFSNNGYETGAVVLEGENKRQILHTGQDAILFWVGDLDGDNKPDLFLEVSESDYFANHLLFLSSQAQKGKIVKKVACLALSYSC